MIRIARADQVLAYAAFERVRLPLLEKPAHHLEQPVAIWVGASDRGLPMAFMGRSVLEILNTPFDALYATHGVGHKKFMRLVHLLERAVVTSANREQPKAKSNPTSSKPAEPNPIEAEMRASGALPVGVDDHRVANDMWDHWRTTVQRFELGNETLGRLVRSLQDLPRPLWRTPLNFYAELTLTTIEELPAHGRKRVNAVLEVFDDLHRMLAAVEPTRHASISVLPKCVAQLDRWSCSVLLRSDFPSVEEIDTCFIGPIAELIRINADPELAAWATSHLLAGDSKDGATPSAFQRKKLAEILHVRWPEGEAHVRALAARATDHEQPEARQRFASVGQLFFADGRYAPPRPAVMA